MNRWTSVLAVAIFAGAGCASPSEPLPPEWKGRNLEATGWDNKTITGNWSFGLEYSMPADHEVTWDWVTLPEGNLTFSLLIAFGGQAFPIVQGQANNDRGAYKTRQAGAYLLVWDADAVPGTVLHFKAPEGAKRNDYPPGDGPECPGGFMLC